MTELEISELRAAWEDFQNYGRHEGECGFSGECPECGTPKGRCAQHAESMSRRQSRMQAAIDKITNPIIEL